MDHHSVNLNDAGVLFLSLKPRLLKCTTFAMESMRISQKNELPTEGATSAPDSTKKKQP